MKKNNCYIWEWEIPELQKLLRVMKLTTFLLLISVISVFAGKTYSQTKILNLSMKNSTVKEVLLNIEEQSEFYFMYSERLVDVNRKVSVSIKNQKIDKVLDNLFAGTNVQHTISDRFILLSTPEVTGNQSIFLQQKSVSGKVADEEGKPLPGVTVVIKGTNQGVITDIDGNYTISEIPANATLHFSFVGMKPQEVAVGDQTTINITMVIDAIGLEEVVAVGYATQRKATLTGSVSNVSSKIIERSPAISVTNTIAGLMPGVITLNRSGQPGEDVSSIYIRGINTTGSKSPLVVVDGIQNPPGWQRLNPEDINSISILKDASAAIYGARAANGVILITTKRGFKGKPVITYTGNFALSQPTRLPEVAGSGLYAETVNQFAEEKGENPRFTQEEVDKYHAGNDPNYPSYDWYDEILNNSAFQQMQNLNIRGGNDAVQYSISGSYSNQNSIFEEGTYGYKGYTIRSNIDAKITKNIGIHFDINAGWDNRESPGTQDPWYWFNAVPMMPVYWDSEHPSSGIESGNNPAVMVTSASGLREKHDQRLTTKFAFDIKIPWVEGLMVDGYFVYVNNTNKDKNWRTPWTVYDYDKADDTYIPIMGGGISSPQLTQSYNFSSSPFYNLRLSYKRQFDKNFISLFIAGEQQQSNWQTISAFRNGFPSTLIPELYVGNAESQTNSGYSGGGARQSLIGRASYNYMEKYLVDVNFRYDGSHAFPPGNRFGFFPGVSVAWQMKKENFMAGADAISSLKLRGSVGQMGNDAISPYQYLASYTMELGYGYEFGDPLVYQSGLYQRVEPNPNITWEVATTGNLGLDMSLLENSLSFSVDVFKQKRNNILTRRNLAVPKFAYLNLPDENIGTVENQGVDLHLSYRNKPAVGGFTYSVAGNVGFNKSEVIDLDEAENVPDYQKAQGHIVGAGLYYVAEGIIRTEDQLNSLPVYPGTRVGDLYYQDKNEDGVISAADRVRMDRSSIPQITFGFNFTLGYKNFSLFGNFAGQGKAWTYYHQNAKDGINSLEDLLKNRYTPGSMDSKYPNIPQVYKPNMEVSGLYSTFWLQNASFLRFKTLELGYDFPDQILSKLSLGSLRLYLNGNNLFVLSDIKWFDPESNNSRGIYYPQNKLFNLGVRVSF